MKGILKSEKLREVLSLAQTKEIAVYIMENDHIELLDVEKSKKDIFLNRLLEIFPSLQPYDLESCDIFKKICETDLSKLKTATKEVINTILNKNQEVMHDYMGLNDNLPLTYSQIAEKYGISQNSAYQLIFRASCEKLTQREGQNLFLKKLGIIELSEKNSIHLHKIKKLPESFHYIPHLPISMRTFNALISNNIVILEQLTEITEDELLRLRKLPKAVLEEIKEVMNKYGVSLADEKENKDELQNENYKD